MTGDPLAMPDIYDHALLADKKLATHVNDLLEAGTINDRQALCAQAKEMTKHYSLMMPEAGAKRII